jgi:hypothetical protein
VRTDDDTVDVLMNLKVLASVPNSGRLSVEGLLTVDNTIHGQFSYALVWRFARKHDVSRQKHHQNIIRASEDIMRAPGTVERRMEFGSNRKGNGVQNLTPKLTGHIRLMPVRMPLYRSCRNVCRRIKVISTFVDSLRVQKFSEDEKIISLLI